MSAFGWFSTGFIAGLIVGALLVIGTAWLVCEWFWRRDDEEWTAREQERGPGARGQVLP
jgi:hypothetical protein